MKIAPIPPNERQRLAALRALPLSQTPEERFDRITRLVMHLLDVPIALVSMVEADHQWFKSAQGVSVSQTPRAHSFCAHAILRPETFVVPDALADDRFADNPLVIGDPHIRFYAGHPLTTGDGSRVGTFCVIDRRSRQLNEEQLQLLRDLAGMVEDQLQLAAVAELRRAVEEREQAERSLRSQADLLDLAHDSIIVRDLADHVTFWNTGAEQQYGWTKDEALGRVTHELLETQFPMPLADIERVLLREGRWEGELVHRTRRGERIVVASRWSLRKDTAGQPTAVLEINNDVTARRQAEEALASQTRLLNSILENMAEGVVVADEHGRFLLWNPAARRSIGIGSTEAPPEEWSHRYGCYRPDRVTPFPSADLPLARAIRGESTTSEEIFIRNPDHPTGLWISVRGTPLCDEGGTLRGGIVVVHDISERKRVYAELQRAREAAEAANKTKSEFLANMSHEIRTPMNGVLGMAEILLKTKLDRDQHEFVEIIRTSGEALLTLINDVLDFSKIEAGKFELDPHDFRLGDCLGDTLKSLALRAHKKSVELAFHIGPDVPDALYGDWNRLRQVLINLVGNAIKFTEKGEVVVSVDVANGGGPSPVAQSRPGDAPRAPDVSLHFSVRDTGIGIPANKLEDVFAPFVQVDSGMNRKYGGTGLGLAICGRLAELFGGRLWAESEPGQGSTFHFTVRLGLARSPEPPAPVPAVPLWDMPVLVVDDNATNRRILREMLAGWGMLPTLVEGGPAALAALEKATVNAEPFPLILLDTNMPEMDGVSLAERIRGNPRLADVSILMLSSADRQEDMRRCRELGVGGYLTKPVKSSELLAAIQRLLGGRKTHAGMIRSAVVECPAAAAPLRPLNVLLVEDNEFNQRVAIVMLEKEGHQVRVAGDGRKALDLLAKESFDVVLMDVQMPEMDGLQATAALRARERNTGRRVPVVALTAHAMRGDRERFLAAGMDGYVSKPLRAEALMEALGEATGRAGTVRSVAPPSDDSGFNRAATLARVGGKFELFRELSDLFRNECNKHLPQLADALRRGDAERLHRGAHTLKGSIAFFGAPATVETAQKLEDLGRQGNLTGGEEVLARLSAQIERLLAALAETEAP